MIKKYFNLIVLMVVLVLFLSGCGTTTTDIPTTTNATQEVANTTEETSTDDNTPEATTEAASGATQTTEPNSTIEQTTTESSQTVPQETTSISTIPQTSVSQTTIQETEAPALNTLKITGNVAFEMTITLDELKSLDDIMVEEDYYSKNSFGTAEQTSFKGVNLWYLLKNYASINAEASSVTVIAIDGYKMKFTIDQVMKQDYINESEPDKQLPMIIAWEENGTEYNTEDGPPYQLVVGQIGPGDFNKFQWVRNVDSIIVE